MGSSRLTGRFNSRHVRSSFDVLVAGGGPAGATAALELSRCGLSVALIERDTYRTFRVGETLPPMLRPQLTGLGLWKQFLDCSPLESYGIESAWETPVARRQHFLWNPHGCGWHVHRARFDGMLASAAVQAGAELFGGTQVSSFRRESDALWLLDAARGRANLTLSSRMLVDATGRRAQLASRLGAQAHIADRLIGAVTVSHCRQSEQWTLIEAVENGWWYSAPLPSGHLVFTYMTDSDLWRKAKWTDLVESAPLTCRRAGRLLPAPAGIYPAASVLRLPVVGPGWMAIGDAALAFDPLSGQGVLKSIEAGTRASPAIARYLDGDSGGLSAYADWVKETHASFLSMRSQFYHSVQRWPASSQFWRRRAAT